MAKHVVVDGSNIATEGRSAPSLRQLNEAVLAFIEEHPQALITVVVDATFGHRIDASEVGEFDEAIANNELVCPPAGAIGRGDAFVLSIANKVGATILSNDSYQEFHGDYTWLFDEGRLVGGKPVPHIGWVFVARTPVRGPVSRKAVKARKSVAKDGKATRPSALASLPMPVPTSPPPRAGKDSGRGATKRAPAKSTGRDGSQPDHDEQAIASGESTAASAVTNERTGRRSRRGGRRQRDEAAKATSLHAVDHAEAPGAAKASFVNEPLPFLTFVESHPIGSDVRGSVESYASHGAYLLVDGTRCYVPLRYLADPAPRAARDLLRLGESYPFVVVSFNPARRSIDLAAPGHVPDEVSALRSLAPTSPPSSEVVEKPRAATRKVAAKKAAPEKATKKAAPEKVAPAKKVGKKAAAPEKVVPAKVVPAKVAAKQAAPEKAATRKVAAKQAAPEKVVPAKVAAKQAASEKVVPTKAATQRVAAKRATPEKLAPAKAATKKATAEKLAPAKAAPAKASDGRAQVGTGPGAPAVTRRPRVAKKAAAATP